jgi:competence ComEA-like helix-hairpin-helix protein
VVLPEVLCGPAFDIDRVGEMTFTVPKGDLLSQLSTGQVSVALADIAKQLPPDWIADTTVQVVLDLPTIVAAIPPELLMPGGEMVEDAEASASLGSFFSPREGVPEVADGEEAVSAAAAEAPAAPVAEPQPVESGPMVALAASAVLEQLPENLRGPAWSADLAIQDVSFPVADLVRQLATGRVAVPAAELAAQLPANVLASVDGEVELPLDVVVMSIPPEALSIQGEEDEDVAAAARLGSFFAPTAAAPDVPEPATPPPAPEPAEAVPEPELAPVEPTPQPVPEPVAAAPAPPPPEGATLIPIASLLATVPANLRGPAWSDSGSPEGSLVLASDEVLGQLRTGRVAVSAQQLAAAFPAGWLVPNADGEIELPLDQVVAAVPSDVMALTNDTVDMVAEAKEIPDLFGVGIAVPSVPQETAPAEVTSAAPVDEEDETVEEELEPEAELPVEPSVSVAAEKSPAPRAEKESTKVEHDWDGVEQSLERAPRGVDINSANLHELATLPGVGETRGEAIVRYREEHGRFESIYDLARVPGIGPSLFRKMTGISLGAQGSRHDRLNSLLDLPQDRRPFLSRLANALMDQVGAVGCVLTDRQGLSLAKVGEMATEGDRYAALGSRYFIKTKRHLQQFVGVDADCLIVPGCNPPLLLLCAEDVVMVLALRSSHVASKRLSQARRAMSEVAWLLGCRAVVLKY